ncbi:hypothetical protein [Arthrobacter sp. UYCu712]|uniref:hypothetical protein n=1 Tax=Arthrobacter sp. UYCu712 TaxID=3156340 RepID=UPI003399C982
MEFKDFVSVLVAIVAIYAIYENNKRADRRDNKTWYRKMVMENSVSFLGKMDVARARITDTYEAYYDEEGKVSDAELDERAVDNLTRAIGDLRDSGQMLKLCCSPETEIVVDEVHQVLNSALRLLKKSRNLSHHSTSPGTPKFDEFVEANDAFMRLEELLPEKKKLLLERIKSDLEHGVAPTAEESRLIRSAREARIALSKILPKKQRTAVEQP